MNISANAAPLLFAVTMLAAGGLAISQANAADIRMSDAGYISAARCAGLAQGVGQDTGSFDRVLDRQSASRENMATILADSARQGAVREARLSGYWRARAAAEVSSACQSAISGGEAYAQPRTADTSTGR